MRIKLNHKSFWGSALALSALVFVFAGCSASLGARQDDKSRKSGLKKREVVIPVEVTEPQRGDISSYYETTSRVEAERRVQVAAEGGGRCIELLVEEGDQVEQGTVLAELKKDEAKALLRQAKVNVEKTRIAYELAQKQSQEGHGTKVDRDNTHFNHEGALAELEMREIALDNLTIRAPIGGTITARDIRVGALISIGTTVFTIVDPDSFMLVINPPEKELPRLKVGQEAEVRIDALPGRQFKAHVRRINPNVDPSSGTIKVVLDFDAEARRSIPEAAFARVKLVMATNRNVLLLPKETVLDEDGRRYVYVVREAPEDSESESSGPAEQPEERWVAKRVEIRTALEDSSRVQVYSGISDGDRVVINGHYSLKPDALVTILNLQNELEAKAGMSAEEVLAAAKNRRENMKDEEKSSKGRHGGKGFRH